jgi:APA family basic amino acid/polyamine antiporter
LKVLLILVFIACGFLITPHLQNLTFLPSAGDWQQVLSPAFAVSLIYVTYAYSGWNASSYVAGEIKNPSRLLPVSLFSGTLLVTILYVLLNYTFLITAPASEMAGQVDVGYISAFHIFGQTGGDIMGMLISFLLISSISSMVFVGPRVSQVMGEDYKLLGFLSMKNRKGIPLYAILLQSAISFVMILTGSFEAVLTYTGFTLNLFTFLAVAGVIVHRIRFPEATRPYKTFGYPVVPFIFLIIMGWTLFFLITEKTTESLAGFATVAGGLIIYFADKYVFAKKK